MNAIKKGLYDVSEVMDPDPSLGDLRTTAERLIDQSAGLALVCSHALDSVLSDSCNDVELNTIADTVSHVCYQIWNDIQTAICAVNNAGGVSMMGRTIDAFIEYVETHDWAALLLMALCALACMSADSWFA